jgi:hypothetical protein
VRASHAAVEAAALGVAAGVVGQGRAAEQQRERRRGRPQRRRGRPEQLAARRREGVMRLRAGLLRVPAGRQGEDLPRWRALVRCRRQPDAKRTVAQRAAALIDGGVVPARGGEGGRPLGPAGHAAQRRQLGERARGRVFDGVRATGAQSARSAAARRLDDVACDRAAGHRPGGGWCGHGFVAPGMGARVSGSPPLRRQGRCGADLRRPPNLDGECE